MSLRPLRQRYNLTDKYRIVTLCVCILVHNYCKHDGNQRKLCTESVVKGKLTLVYETILTKYWL